MPGGIIQFVAKGWDDNPPFITLYPSDNIGYGVSLKRSKKSRHDIYPGVNKYHKKLDTVQEKPSDFIQHMIDVRTDLIEELVSKEV